MDLRVRELAVWVSVFAAAMLCVSCSESSGTASGGRKGHGQGSGGARAPAGATAPQAQGAQLTPLSNLEEDGFAYVRIEAESGKIINETAKLMRIAADDGASRGKCIEIPDKAGVPKDGKLARVVYTFRLTKAGFYTFWCRRKWHDSCGDTLYVRFNRQGQPRTRLAKQDLFGSDDSSKPPRWGWSPLREGGNPRQVYLRAGLNVMEILNNEDGPRFDVILLTNDRDFVPVGLED